MTDHTARRVYLRTFGCQMNDYDSARMLRLLQLEGFTQTATAADADLVIFNTCSVRAKAEQKALSQIGRLKKLRRDRPAMRIVVAGCFAQRSAAKLLHKYPHIDMVLGTDAIGRLPGHARKLMDGFRGIVDVDFAAAYDEDVEDFGEIIPGKGSKVAAFTTIMRGCNNFCAYCIVPYVRGRERSRPVVEVLREVRQLAAKGVKEITLLGQNVNSYGQGSGVGEVDFAALLRQVHEIEGIRRIRFTTSHPKDLSDRLIEAFAELPKLANHLHLPVQAGSDAVLRAMNRGYEVARYLDRLQRLRDVRENMAITTDILVGFPGETEADFQQTLDLVAKVGYSNSFVFRYSVRPETAAEKLHDDVPEKEKIARLMAVQKMQREITLRQHENLVGQKVEVLVERRQDRDQDHPWSGKSGCYRGVHFAGDGVAVGDVVTVECLQAYANHLLGKAVTPRDEKE
ncbi:MAG: tRNA (N6-isopentenyl adenosine(37)-C2)-methylthiotransferase MiaB [Candidatus Lernaella stagnicola]|nr:tRNA (N6-isopentenyl adenosine(37)-C2)-methylthiotransferase MiaB [Candidatus Lernaella stagnicola]